MKRDEKKRGAFVIFSFAPFCNAFRRAPRHRPPNLKNKTNCHRRVFTRRAHRRISLQTDISLYTSMGHDGDRGD